jgi:ribosomal protein S18 acetylase RimI-like enzyme
MTFDYLCRYIMHNHTIIYRIKSASENDIRLHLEACNSQFIPPLDTQVDLVQYAKKLFRKAVTFEALAGLVAAYFTDKTDKNAFITNVSLLKEYRNQGLASKLMDNCIDYAGKNNIASIRLEVNRNNITALKLYEKYHFKQDQCVKDLVVMTLQLIHEV